MSSVSTRYRCELSIVGSNFFEQFNWESENNLTHGRVNYLTLEQAKAKNLFYATNSPYGNSRTITVEYKAWGKIIQWVG